MASWRCWLLMFDVLFPCDCAPTLKEERRFFHYCCHQLACTSEFSHRLVRALATSPPKHSFRAESFFGGVLLRIIMLAERYVPLKNIAVSRSSCLRGHYLLTVNLYFFVSTILNRYGNYPELPTNTDQKIPRHYLFPICSTLSTTVK